MRYRRRRRVLLAVDVLLLVCAVASLLVWSTLSSAQTTTTSGERISIHDVDEASFVARTPEQPFFILLIGNDGRPGLEGVRGDAIHVLGINPVDGSATILNIPRDTWVPIPGHGNEKITRSMEFGGLQLQVQTIAGLTGVPFSFAVTVGFEGFKALVNEMGGVTVNVPFDMFDRNSNADFRAGPTQMFGDAALSYARNRHVPNGDILRTEHQGQLLIGGLTRAREVASSPIEVVRLLGMIVRHTTFEGVSIRDLYTLVSLGLSIDPSRVRNVTMPSTIGKVGKADVVFAAPGAASLFADFRDDAILQSH